MPDPKKPWERNLEVQSDNNSTKPWERGLVTEPEKKNPVGTSAAESLGTAETAGLSVTNAPKPKSPSVKNNPFGTNTIPGQLPSGSGLPTIGKTPAAKVVSGKKKAVEQRGFLENVADKLQTGSAQLGVDIAAIPELAYDVFAAPQNAVADIFDIPALHADAEKFKKNQGVKNAVKDYYKNNVAQLRQKAQLVDEKYKAGIYDSFRNGDIKDGFKQLTQGFAESLPATSGIMLGGAYAKGAQLLAGSSIVFGAGKNEKLKDENKDMNNNTRVANALATGLIQGGAETLGTGSIGAAARGLVEREGSRKAVSILKDGLVDFYKSALMKNPLLASMTGEGLEEAFQGVAENAVDVATGAKPEDFNVYSTAADDFLGGAFAGSVFGGGMKGLNQVANIQDKQTIKTNMKKVFALNNELENPDISEASKSEISKSIEKLVKESQALVQRNVEHVENLSPEELKRLKESVATIENNKAKAKEIKLDPNTSTETKKILLSNLAADFKKATEVKNDILKGKQEAVSGEQTAAGSTQAVDGPPAVPENYNIVDTQVTVPSGASGTEAAGVAETGNRNTDLFPDTSSFGNEVGHSGADANLSSYADVDGVGVSEYTNPDNGLVDVYMSGTSDHDFVGYVRVYENGKPTNRFTSKMENKSGDKAKLKTMLTELQKRLPENHEYTESTSVSTDGINVFAQQLNHGYEIATDENGNPITNTVAINGDSMVNNLGIDVNQGSFDNIVVTDNKSFNKVKQALVPLIAKLGLTENDIIWEDGTVKINLPVLRKKGSLQAADGSLQNAVTENTNTNEAVQSTNTPVDGNAAARVSPVGESGNTSAASSGAEAATETAAEENIPEAGDGRGAEGKTSEVVSAPNTKRIKLTPNGQAFVVTNKNGKLEVRKENGLGTSGVSAPTRRAVLRKYADSHDFTQGERAIDRPDFSGNLDDFEREVAEKSTNAAEVAQTALYAESFAEDKPIEHTADYKQSVIADALDKIKESSFNSFDDRNNASKAIKKNYFDDKGRGIYELAQEMSDRAGVEITPKDITDFIKEHPKGVEEFYKKQRKAAESTDNKSLQDINALKEKFTELTGLPATAEFLKKAVDQQNMKNELASGLYEMSDEELQRKYDEIQQLEKEQNESEENKPTAKVADDSKNAESSGEKPSGESDNNREADREKEVKTKVERKKAADASIDELANFLKTKLAITHTEGSRKNGISQDELIDFIADSAKRLAHAGIDVHEAVKQVMDTLSEQFDLGVSAKEVIDKHFSEPEQAEEAIEDEQEQEPTDVHDMTGMATEEGSFEERMANVPESGIKGIYDSKEIIESFDENEKFDTNQEYDKLKLADAFIYGKQVVEDLKRQFGDKYVDKAIEIINGLKNTDAKLLNIVSLLGDLRRQRMETTDIKEKQRLTDEINKLQPLRQELANTASRSMNMLRLERFAATGKMTRDFSESVYSEEENKTRKEIDKALNSTPEQIQQTYEDQQSEVEDFFDEKDFAVEEFELEVPKNKRNKDAVKKDLAEAMKQMRKALIDAAKGGGMAMSSLPFAQQIAAATPHVIKISKLLAELGIINGKKAVDYIHNELRKTFPGVGKKDIAGIIQQNTTSTKKPLSERKQQAEEKRKAKEKVNEAQDLLVQAGYGKEITVSKTQTDADGNKTKVKEKKQVIDWKKLMGESGSITSMRNTVTEELVKQGKTQAEAEAMADEMQAALEEIKAKVAERSLADLQQRNKISKEVNVASEARKLGQAYQQGMFDEDMDKYNVVMNKILGFDKFRNKQYEDLKDLSARLADLFAAKDVFDERKLMSEGELKTQISHINKQINEIINKAAIKEGGVKAKVFSMVRSYADMSMLSKLLSMKQMVDNPVSGFIEQEYQKLGSMFDKTKLPAGLKKQINKGAASVFKDIAGKGSPDLGDSSFSEISGRKLEGFIRGFKTKKGGAADQVKNALAGTLGGTVYLSGMDSYYKMKSSEITFYKAMIDILSNPKYGRDNVMSHEDAVKFVSEAVTGENFDKALTKAEETIKEINQKAGREVLPDTKENIYRFAMDIVKGNLVKDGVMDQDSMKKIFSGAFKAAGSGLGHEVNNPISEAYKKVSSHYDMKIKEAVKNKNWDEFAKYVTLTMIKNTVAPFVSGRFNWMVLQAQKSNLDLGLSMINTGRKASKNKIDFSSEEGLKNVAEAVHQKYRHEMTVKRSLVGLAVATLGTMALVASGKDEDLEETINKSPTLKKLFKWLAPPLLNLYFAEKNKGGYGMLKYLMDFYSVTGNSNTMNAGEAIMKLVNEKSKKKSKKKAMGELGKILGKAVDTPLPWRVARDFGNVANELKGKEQYESNYNATSIMSGFLQGGMFDYVGIRDMLNNETGVKEKKSKKKKE